jgi:hypothetical protein
MLMEEPVPVVGGLLFLTAVVGFVLPGFGWVTWLHRADRLAWPVRLVLGFAWSFALFSALGGPFLWYQGRFDRFMLVFYPLWILYALGGAIAFVRSRREPAAAGADMPPAPAAVEAPGRFGGLLFYAYLALATAVVVSRGFGKAESRDSVAKETDWLFRGFLVALLLGGWLAWQLRDKLAARLAFTVADAAAPPRLWTAAAVVAVLLQAAGAVLYDRPDWDDGFYLAAVLDYEQAPILNAEEPTHREGFPMSVLHRAMCWELWGAVLCHVSGISPLVLYHSLLPGLLALAAYAAYGGLFAELLPRRWVPLALLGLSGYFIWGISSHWTAANHLLIRSWQGKAVLLHITLPLVVLMLCRFARRADWRNGLTLGACVVAGLGASSSAIFLAVALVACLALALMPTVKVGRIRFLICAGLALTPLAVEALGIVTALRPDFFQDAATAPIPAVQRWRLAIDQHLGGGSIEVAWAAALPLLAVLLIGARSRAYFLVFPILLFLTFANPFFCNFVMGHVTTPDAYQRIFWLFPVGPGLAALLALLARLSARPGSMLAGFAPLAICGGGLALGALLPGKYVWGARNNYGAYMTPHRAENLEKMPADLLPIARQLAADPDIEAGSILCGEEVAPFLAPYCRRFRFVVTRPFYTVPYVSARGQARDAMERYYLQVVVRWGSWANGLADYDWSFFARYLGPRTTEELRRGPKLTLGDVPDLLKRYHVEFVVTSPPLEMPPGTSPEQLIQQRDRLFQDNQYEVVYRGADYVLWKKSVRGGRRAG